MKLLTAGSETGWGFSETRWKESVELVAVADCGQKM
jgi:hypothetical protein